MQIRARAPPIAFRNPDGERGVAGLDVGGDRCTVQAMHRGARLWRSLRNSNRCTSLAGAVMQKRRVSTTGLAASAVPRLYASHRESGPIATTDALVPAQDFLGQPFARALASALALGS